MGIDFRVTGSNMERPRWSYGGFNRFRTRLAKLIGLNLKEMVGFGGVIPFPSPDAEPIVYLLDHSDCDGDMPPDQCRVVAPRLEQLLFQLDVSCDDDYDHEQGQRLATLMRDAARLEERLIFC